MPYIYSLYISVCSVDDLLIFIIINIVKIHTHFINKTGLFLVFYEYIMFI